MRTVVFPLLPRAIGALAGLLCCLLAVAAAPAMATTVNAIAAGDSDTCAVTSAGALKCWGLNIYGQLGDGTTTNSSMPVDVSRLDGGVSAIAAGYYHTCELTSAGAAKCWGQDANGQLGDDALTVDRATPVAVFGLPSGVSAIATGGYHTCALTSSGAVNCWGHNYDGQLGIGTYPSDRPTPVAVVGLSSGVGAIAAGTHHTCALTISGAVKCWGYNEFGQVGDGLHADRISPVGVSGLGSGVRAITAGYAHTCALTTGGAVKCWGFNGYGQLGDGTTTDRATPVGVAGLSSGVSAITAGDGQTCALTTAGAVKCWGYNADGQLGDATTTNRLTPVAVSGLASGVSAISAGSSHTCALTGAGAVKCWGSNGVGELGDGTTTGRRTPVDTTLTRATTATVNDSALGTTAGTFAYTGTWSASTGTGKYLGDDHYSSTTNSSYTFRFTGTQVSLYGAKAAYHGQASVRIDGGTSVTIDQYAASRQDNVLVYGSPVLLTGAHTVTVTVKGTHQAASTGNTITIDRATYGRPPSVSANDSRTGTAPSTFAYAGTWSTSTGAGKYWGDDHYSSTTGSSYTYRFTGTQVALYGAKASLHGQASVQIDGGAAATIDQYAATRRENVLVYQSPVLAPGPHAVKVTVKGTHQPASTGNVIAIDHADWM